MEFNPPYGYTLLTYFDKSTSSENILVGLGNGTLLRFKRKKLVLQEIKPDIHLDQICAMSID